MSNVERVHLPEISHLTQVQVPSFVDLQEIIPTWTDLSDVRRANMLSAVQTIAKKVIRQPMANIECRIEHLNESLFQRSAAACGLSTARFQDMLSMMRAILRRLGLHVPQPGREALLGQAWQSFLQAIPTPALRAGLRGFARWCDAGGLAPKQVDDAALAGFLAADQVSRISASAKTQGPGLAAAWARAVALQADPTAFPVLKSPRRREPYTLPFDQYPTSFQADVAAYQNTLGGGGKGGGSPFTVQAAPRRRLAKGTIKSRLFSIRQAAAALVITGTPVEAITRLADLVQPIERAAQILDFFFNMPCKKAGGQIRSIAETLRQVGKHHVKVSAEDLANLSAWAAQAEGETDGAMSPKTRARLLAMIAPRARAMLLHLPALLEKRAAAAGLAHVECTMTVRTALTLELLTTCPTRVGNIQLIRMDQQLLRLNGPRLPSHLFVDGSEVKNGQPIQWPLAKSTAALIQRYLDHFRPALAEPGNPYLFPGEGQGPLSRSAFVRMFVKEISETTGLLVSPHDMRSFAAWSFLNGHPGAYEVVRRMLGHRQIETTIAFYCGLETDAAAQLLDNTVMASRKETKVLAASAFRGAGRRRAAGARKAGR